jgi:streptomycin 3"-adenylyltransferase
MGCFNPLSSDLDLLAVVREKLSIEQKKEIIDYLLDQHGKVLKKGIEMSIVLEDSLLNFEYPTPFELHYSSDWYERYEAGNVDFSEQRYDEDLAAHFVMVRNRGICIYGKPVEDAFPEIPEEFYVRSIMNDADYIYRLGEKDPVYSILNLCRIIAFIKDRIITSKKEAGEWALSKLPEKYTTLINTAGYRYNTGDTSEPVDTQAFKDFIEYAKYEIDTLKLHYL